MSDNSEDNNLKICFCHNVSLSRLREAFEDGALTFEDLQEKTRCSTGCGGCEFEVKAILEDFLEKTKTA